tara:strand:- start:25942 stop:27264 length:1323 start_codon:yes stop_codon:yes gene_type:complete
VSVLKRIGLARRDLRAWALYDCANSAFSTTVITAVFPLFFANFVAANLEPAVATARFALATTIAASIIAVLGPFLGAIADYRSEKKKLLAICVALGVTATSLMVLIDAGEWQFAISLFIVSNIALGASLIFYDSLLPHIASSDEIDQVSTSGFALGYLGGGVLLLINLAWILSPATFGLPDVTAAIKLSFASVAIWWLVFSIPLLRHVLEPAGLPIQHSETRQRSNAEITLTRVITTFRELRNLRNPFLMLLAFFLYNDGVQTIIRMSAIYGAEIGIGTNAQLAAFVTVQFVGIPFAFLFGKFANHVGPKLAILVSLAVYTGICVLGYFMTTAWHFFTLAILVGMVQGGSQALSRSLFARMIPRYKSSEYFGFFSVFQRLSGILGPAVFAAVVTATGSSRPAVFALIAFFAAGALVLSRVNVLEGEQQARALESVAEKLH